MATQWLDAIRLGAEHRKGGEEGEDFRIARPLRESGDTRVVLSLKILSWELNRPPLCKTSITFNFKDLN